MSGGKFQKQEPPSSLICRGGTSEAFAGTDFCRCAKLFVERGAAFPLGFGHPKDPGSQESLKKRYQPVWSPAGQHRNATRNQPDGAAIALKIFRNSTAWEAILGQGR